MDQMHEIDLKLNDLRKTYLLPAPLLHRRGQGKVKLKRLRAESIHPLATTPQ